jgi:GNAT superfamily N-acetyltransferase
VAAAQERGGAGAGEGAEHAAAGRRAGATVLLAARVAVPLAGAVVTLAAAALVAHRPILPAMKPVPTVALRRGRMRRATLADREAITEVMVASARELSRGFYSEAQIPSVVTHIAVLDELLVEDGTYFVIEDVRDGEEAVSIAACGGWSRRDKLFTGMGAAAGGTALLVPGRDPARIRAMFVHPKAARRGFGQAILAASERDARDEGFLVAELMSTAPGEPLYTACGYEVLERTFLHLPDGCDVAAAKMRKALA